MILICNPLGSSSSRIYTSLTALTVTTATTATAEVNGGSNIVKNNSTSFIIFIASPYCLVASCFNSALQ